MTPESIPFEALKMADDLLNELDAIARGVCSYEYGLPIYGEEKDKMRALVLAALSSAKREAEPAQASAVVDAFWSGTLSSRNKAE